MKVSSDSSFSLFVDFFSEGEATGESVLAGSIMATAASLQPIVTSWRTRFYTTVNVTA